MTTKNTDLGLQLTDGCYNMRDIIDTINRIAHSYMKTFLCVSQLDRCQRDNILLPEVEDLLTLEDIGCLMMENYPKIEKDGLTVAL